MKLWMIQPANVFEQWRDTGSYQSDIGQVDPAFRQAYLWMAAQMRRRLPAPLRENQVPVWAWQQARSEAKPRPDLRSSGFAPPGTSAVLLSLDVPASEVLLSDFDLWHYALNDWYLPATAADRTTGRSRSARERSWQRIFDLEFAAPGIADPRACKAVQATFWELSIAHITAVQPFKAR